MRTRPSRTPKAAPTPWYRSWVFITLALFIYLPVWFVWSGSTSRVLDTQPTHLSLRSDICGFLKARGVAATAIAPGNWCSVVVPYRNNVIGRGGVIKLGDREIQVAGDQLIEVGAVVDQPWTPEQTSSALWMGIRSLFLVALLGWMIVN